jgi:hypothetical protein
MRLLKDIEYRFQIQGAPVDFSSFVPPPAIMTSRSVCQCASYASAIGCKSREK